MRLYSQNLASVITPGYRYICKDKIAAIQPHLQIKIKHIELNAMARLIRTQNGEVLEEIPITKTELRIGRASDNDIVLLDDTVSSHHAILTVDFSKSSAEEETTEQYHIKDLQSTNKTFVNNKEITSQTLSDKDVVRVGLANFELDLSNNDAAQREFEHTTKIHKSWIPGVFYTKK